MFFNKISMFVLSLVLSCEALMAGPVMRAGALRLNSNSTTSSKSSSTASSTASVGALATYERASRLRPNRVQASSSSGSSTINQEILNKVYEEMSRVTNAVEQELYITQREIDKLKDEIAEKDDKISDLEEALAEYEEVKTTVKNIPNVYYSKKEVDAKGYVMPKTLESAITSAKADAREAAVEEINRKGFITRSAVADEIAQAKTAAVGAAVAQVENMNFATANSVAAAESRMANAIDNAKTVITKERNAALQLYAKASDVASEISVAKDTAIADAKQQAIVAIEGKNYATKQFVNNEISNLDFNLDEVAVGTIIENKLSAKDFATNTALQGERTARENALKEYATISVVEDRINNLDLGVDETAVATIVENKLTAKDFATNTALQGERTARENALKEYATKEEVEGVDNKFKDISETVAVDLAKNDNFKAQVLSSLDTSISELPSKVTAVENRLATMNNQLFDDEQKPVFVKKPELDTLITVDLIDSKLPTTVCKTKDCLTATIGDHYTTNSTVVSKIDTAKAELNSAITAAKGEAIDGAVAQAGTVFLKSSDLANNATIVNLNNKFKDYTKTADMNSAITTAANDAKIAAISQATTDRTAALQGYATKSSLNDVDSKFKSYTTTADMNNAITTAKTAAINQAASERTAALKAYTTTVNLNDTVGGLAVIKALPTSSAMNSAITTAKAEAVSQAASDRATALKAYTTTANLNDTVGGLAVIKALPTSTVMNSAITTAANNAKTAAISQAASDRAAALQGYATNSSLNDVDSKFKSYTTTAAMNSAITTAANNAKAAAISQAATDRATALKNYTTTANLNNTVGNLAVIKALPTTATMNSAISTAKTEINSTINTVKNAVIGIAGNTKVTFDNVTAPNCTTGNGCVVSSEWKPGGGAM